MTAASRLSIPMACLGLAVTIGAGVVAAASAADPSGSEMGGRYRHALPDGSPYPAVGCWDHRALMFIVREMGTDADAARQLAQRDCRPLVADGIYLKCGPGGSTFPAEGGPQSYSGYCRAGASDIQLYVLDLMMQPAAEPMAQ